MNISIVIGNMALDAELNGGPTARKVVDSHLVGKT